MYQSTELIRLPPKPEGGKGLKINNNNNHPANAASIVLFLVKMAANWPIKN